MVHRPQSDVQPGARRCLQSADLKGLEPGKPRMRRPASREVVVGRRVTTDLAGVEEDRPAGAMGRGGSSRTVHQPDCLGHLEADAQRRVDEGMAADHGLVGIVAPDQTVDPPDMGLARTFPGLTATRCGDSRPHRVGSARVDREPAELVIALAATGDDRVQPVPLPHPREEPAHGTGFVAGGAEGAGGVGVGLTFLLAGERGDRGFGLRARRSVRGQVGCLLAEQVGDVVPVAAVAGVVRAATSLSSASRIAVS